MKLSSTLLFTLVTLSMPLQATHLREADVEALEATCEELRAALLAPEKLDVLDQCLDSGEADVESCRDKAGKAGESRHVGTNYFVGEHYDLPECVEAYRARKHYQVNPSLRDR